MAVVVEVELEQPPPHSSMTPLMKMKDMVTWAIAVTTSLEASQVLFIGLINKISRAVVLPSTRFMLTLSALEEFIQTMTSTKEKKMRMKKMRKVVRTMPKMKTLTMTIWEQTWMTKKKTMIKWTVVKKVYTMAKVAALTLSGTQERLADTKRA